MNRSLFTSIAPLALILLAGCNSIQSRQSTGLVKPLSESTLSQQQTEQQRIADEQARLDTCRKALESLKEVNPKQADKLGNEFTALLSAASQYNSVRSKVAEPTKQGIDSMYQFKSIKLCADIEKELIDSLVKRGENVQP
ncbi:permease [Klebsiella michiganensis]|uniref:permease n=1 Tax=Klebsiella michiganensis TaxID=1134687 RepID=UPI0020B7338E|nr:permease [Klebsiella michiganensis]